MSRVSITVGVFFAVLIAGAVSAQAQYYAAPVVTYRAAPVATTYYPSAPVVTTYRPAPVVATAPVVAYRPAPVVTYRTAPVVTTYQPAPVVAYRPAPVITYRPAPVVTTYRPAPVVTTYSPVYPAVVTAGPVVVDTDVYVPGQPVRNLLRALTW